LLPARVPLLWLRVPAEAKPDGFVKACQVVQGWWVGKRNDLRRGVRERCVGRRKVGRVRVTSRLTFVPLPVVETPFYTHSYTGVRVVALPRARVARAFWLVALAVLAVGASVTCPRTSLSTRTIGGPALLIAGQAAGSRHQHI
jgi:hypothetical protein